MSAARRRLLLVEDARDTRELFAEALHVRGFEVVQAADGMEALSLAKAAVPDVVVLDIGLPRLDGFYVAELWKRDPSMQKVPVIALSAFTEGDYETRALQAGCASALRKPCAPDVVVREIERLLP
jgi:two-component system cell cycle response regulator DivK